MGHGIQVCDPHTPLNKTKINSMSMSTSSRAMAFIDWDNIAIPAKNFFGIRYLNYNSLRSILLGNYNDVGGTVYLPNKMRNLIGPIQRCGFRVEVVSPGKSVDGRLMLDLMICTDQDDYDVAVLASGDRDYSRVVEYVKRKGKEVAVASFSRNLAPSLSNVASAIIDLDGEAVNLSARLYSHTCATCGKAFDLPFRVRGTPLCRDCRS